MPSLLVENPWPLGLALLVVALAGASHGLREGRRDTLLVGAVAGLLGAGVFVLAALVTTSAEHAERVVRELLAAVEAGDAPTAMRHFDPDATVHVGSTRNPGMPIDRLGEAMAQFLRSVDVESIIVTGLRTEDALESSATVHLGCLAQTDRYGPGTTQWIIDVARDAASSDPAGAWRIARITWTMLDGQPPRGLSGVR